MLGSDVYGNITRINNALEAIKDKIPDERLRIEDIEKQLENAKIEMQKPFPQEELFSNCFISSSNACTFSCNSFIMLGYVLATLSCKSYIWL